MTSHLADTCWEARCETCGAIVESSHPTVVTECYLCDGSMDHFDRECVHGVHVSDRCGACEADERGDFLYEQERERRMGC